MLRFFLPALTGLLLVTGSLQAQSKAAQSAYKKAIGYLNKGKTDKGFVYLDKALQADSNYREALYAKGYYSFEKADYPTARASFDRLLSLYPKDTTFYRYRALTLMYLDDYEASERDLLQALSLDNTHVETYNDLGYLYYQWGRIDEALAQFDQSLKLKPNKKAQYYKALTFYETNQNNQALEWLEKALKEDPKYPLALRLKANILSDTKKYAEAIKIYEGLANNGDLAEPDDLLDWGLIYYKMKKYDQALVYFTIPENHQSAVLYYYTGLARYRMKQPADALASLNKAVQFADTTDEAYAPLFFDRAIVRSQQNDKRGAGSDLLKSVYLLPEILKRQNAHGDTLELLGSYLLLKGLYNQQQLDKAAAAGYRDRAESLLDTEGGEELALTAINQSLKLDSTNAESYFIRGRVEYLTGQYKQALRDFDKAFKLANGQMDDYQYYLRGLAHFEMDQYQESYEDFSKAIELNNQESAYFYDRAYTLAALGDLSDAVTDINQAMTLQEDNDFMLLVRAGLYNEMGRFADALNDCNTVIIRDSSNALAYCVRGYAYENLKQKSQAIADYSKALKLDPQLDDAKIALEELAGLHH